jgi:hypothetical protein
MKLKIARSAILAATLLAVLGAGIGHGQNVTQQSTNDAAVPPRMEKLIFPNVPVCRDRIAKFETVSIQFTNVEEVENQAASKQRSPRISTTFSTRSAL